MHPTHRTLDRSLALALAIALSARPARAAEPPDPARAAPLRERVARAVSRGRTRLLAQLPALTENPAADYPAGRLAFPVAALLKAGAPSDDPAIAAALEKLARLRPEKTYCIACSILALDALVERRREEGRGAGATRDAEARIAELAARLVATQLRGHGSWTYGKPANATRHDFSNTQFAALGLELAVARGVRVPPETSLGLVRCFARSAVPEGNAVAVEISLEATLEDRIRRPRATPARRFHAVPAGWGYTDRSRTPSSRPDPYPSMTAAGASSILIALDALRKTGGAPPPPEAERTLASAYAWIAAHFDEYLADGPNLYYTLYSLEKVGDLARIEAFGGRAWYDEGAERLLDLQRRDGGWGSTVNTAFALLFLARATRIETLSSAPPVLSGRRSATEEERDLVYIDRLGGFLSARGLLRYVAERRDRELLAVAREAVRKYAPDSAADLVPHLAAFLSKEDAAAAFARDELARITGVESRDPAAYAEWFRERRALEALEAKDPIEAAELRAAMERTENLRLKAFAASIAGRRGLRSLAGYLVAELSRSSPEYRERIHGVLSLWIEPPRPAPPPGGDWEPVASAWRAWWVERGAEFEAAARRGAPEPSGREDRVEE